jgi:hypothetical protein
MKNQLPRLGIDRFLALRWVDMALELRIAGFNKNTATEKMCDWLTHEINGKEVVRKTVNQLNRMWFSDLDISSSPGNWVIHNGLANVLDYRSVIHHGMALIAFPLYRDVCSTSGRLFKLQGKCQRGEIFLRVLEKYSNPESTKRGVDRVLQTLEDWGILLSRDGSYMSREFSISETKLTEWLIRILLQVYGADQLLFMDLINAPELIGINFIDARAAIRGASQLHIDRTMDIEMISLVG